MRISHGLLPFRLSLLSLAIFSLHAQANTESDKAAEKKPEIQKVEVQGKTEYDARRLDTATKIVVTAEEIQKYGDTNMSDVMKRLPGVTPGAGGAVRMRGLGSGYTQVLINGEPAPPGFSIDSISPDVVERIEIIRSATAEHSTQAIAGTLNIVLRKAIKTGQREIKVGMNQDGREFGQNLSMMLSDKQGALSYAINGSVARGNFDRTSFSSVEKSGSEVYQHTKQAASQGNYLSISLAPRVNWNFADGDILTTQSYLHLNRVHGNQHDQSQGQSQSEPKILPKYSGVKTTFFSNALSLGSNLNWIVKLADSAKLDLKAGVNYRRGENPVDSQGYAVSGQQILASHYDAVQVDKGMTFSGKYSAPFIEKHAFVVGWDGAFNRRSEDRVQVETIMGRSQEIPINYNDNYYADVTRIAAYAQDEWQVTPQWSVYAGMRWEGIQTKSAGSMYVPVSHRSSVVSPILQALYKLPNSKNDQIRFGLSRTYKAPSAFSLLPRTFKSSENSIDKPDVVGNPNLKPELAWGWDLAYEHFLPEGGSISASVYLRQISDVPRSVTREIDGRYVRMPSNIGHATAKGIEFDAKFPLRSVLKDAPAIDLRANLNFNWSSVDNIPGPNNRLDAQVPFSMNLGFDYKDIAGLPLTLGGNAHYRSAGDVRVADNQFNYATPKRALDMYALWKFDKSTNLRFSVSDALHQTDYSSSYFVTAANTTLQKSWNPNTVNARLMFEHKF